MDATRAAVSGDLTKMEAARTNLGKIAGEGAAEAAPGAPGAPAPITDLPKFAGDMEKTIVAFQAAIQKNDTATMLKLQRELVDATDRSEAALKTVSTKPAEAMRAITNTVRTAFAGDLSKLDEALGQLRLITASTKAPGTGASGAPAAGAIPGKGQPDLQPLANELRNKLTSLREAAADQVQTAAQPRTTDELNARKADMAKRRSVLQTEIARAEGSARNIDNLDEATAAQIKNMIGVLKEAANGDDAKIEMAARMLEELTAPRR
jgi:hypothetical protein